MKYERISLRDNLGKTLVKVCANMKDVVVLDGDLENSTTTSVWHKEYPEQFYQMGISEVSAMSVAQGLSIEGKIPFNVNFAMFVTGLAWNQLRQICYGNNNVKVIGTHPGLDNGPDGASHHANEDLALTRVLPNLKVLIPSSLEELETSIRLAVEHNGPVYIRVARGTVPVIDTPSFSKMGEAVITRTSDNLDDEGDILLIYEGTSAFLAHEAFDQLDSNGYKVSLLNIGSIKPLDERRLIENIKKHKITITIENHSIIGGLGGAVAEVIAVNNIKTKFSRIGIKDVFTESGNSDKMKEKYGLNVDLIKKIVSENI